MKKTGNVNKNYKHNKQGKLKRSPLVILLFGIAALVIIILFSSSRPLYLDYAATTPPNQNVISTMSKIMSRNFGNPSSIHKYGQNAMNVVKSARENIASVIDADPEEVFFTSGATESDNFALKGFFINPKQNKNHLIISSVEHPAILDTAKYLKSLGFEVDIIDPDSSYRIDPDAIRKKIKKNTLMISVLGVHYLTGVIQPLKEIGKIARDNGVLFHTDCAQAFAKIPLDVDDMNIDLMSISAHKIYGPKGIGAIFIRKSIQDKIVPLIHGGAQQNGIRSGTYSTELIGGFSEATSIYAQNKENFFNRQKKLYDYILNEILKIEGTELIGDPVNKYFGIMRIRFHGVKRPQDLFDAMPNIMISSSSACSSNIDKINSTQDIFNNQISMKNYSDIRFSIGVNTSKYDAMRLIKSLKKALHEIRKN